MDCSLSSWAGSALEPCSCIRVAICTCTKHAHPYCQPTTNQLQNGDRPDELSHATFKRCICCLLKACIFCSDWYWTFTLMSCLSISARLSSSCNTTWSHLLRFQVRFKIDFSGAQLWTYRETCCQRKVWHTSANSEFPLLFGSWACWRTWSNSICRSLLASRDFCHYRERKTKTEATTLLLWKCLLCETKHASLQQSRIQPTMQQVRASSEHIKCKLIFLDYYIVNLFWDQWKCLFKNFPGISTPGVTAQHREQQTVTCLPLMHWTRTPLLSPFPPFLLWFAPAAAAGCCCSVPAAAPCTVIPAVPAPAPPGRQKQITPHADSTPTSEHLFFSCH